ELIPGCSNPSVDTLANGTVNTICVFYSNAAHGDYRCAAVKFGSGNGIVLNCHRSIKSERADAVWGTVDSLPLKLRSKASGLVNDTTFQVYYRKILNEIPKPYCNAKFEVVN